MKFKKIITFWQKILYYGTFQFFTPAPNWTWPKSWTRSSYTQYYWAGLSHHCKKATKLLWISPTSGKNIESQTSKKKLVPEILIKIICSKFQTCSAIGSLLKYSTKGQGQALEERRKHIWLFSKFSFDLGRIFQTSQRYRNLHSLEIWMKPKNLLCLE